MLTRPCNKQVSQHTVTSSLLPAHPVCGPAGVRVRVEVVESSLQLVDVSLQLEVSLVILLVTRAETQCSLSTATLERGLTFHQQSSVEH